MGNDSATITIQLKDFGRNLKRARVARRITLEVLSEKADLNIRTLQRIEAGQTNILMTTALRLRKGLECPWEELFPIVTNNETHRTNKTYKTKNS